MPFAGWRSQRSEGLATGALQPASTIPQAGVSPLSSLLDLRTLTCNCCRIALTKSIVADADNNIGTTQTTWPGTTILRYLRITIVTIKRIAEILEVVGATFEKNISSLNLSNHSSGTRRVSSFPLLSDAITDFSNCRLLIFGSFILNQRKTNRRAKAVKLKVAVKRIPKINKKMASFN